MSDENRPPRLGYALAAVAVFALSGLVFLYGCAPGETAPAPSAAGDASATENAADVEELPVAEDFTLENVDGSAYTLSARQGKVRLIDFWATWCAPCREEVPMMNRLHSTYSDQGFEVVAISDFDESGDVVREFVKEYEVEYVNLLGSEEEMGDKYIVMGLPMAYLIDRQGRIAESYFGPKPAKALEERIKELLAQELSN